jgi:hypothetical protein
MKNSKPIRVAMPGLLAVGLLLAADPASALRCKNKLVSEGDPQSKVLRFCGEPEAMQTRTIYRAGLPRRQPGPYPGSADEGGDRELVYADRAYVETIVEEWTYNFGPRRLMRRIRFENGLVASITQLGDGYL